MMLKGEDGIATATKDPLVEQCPLERMGMIKVNPSQPATMNVHTSKRSPQ